MEPGSLALQSDSLPSEPPVNPHGLEEPDRIPSPTGWCPGLCLQEQGMQGAGDGGVGGGVGKEAATPTTRALPVSCSLQQAPHSSAPACLSHLGKKSAFLA